jgi:hypothetical protein
VNVWSADQEHHCSGRVLHEEVSCGRYLGWGEEGAPAEGDTPDAAPPRAGSVGRWQAIRDGWGMPTIVGRARRRPRGYVPRRLRETMTIARRLWLGFGVLILIFFIILLSERSISRSLAEIEQVEGSIRAVAYEMEIFSEKRPPGRCTAPARLLQCVCHR